MQRILFAKPRKMPVGYSEDGDVIIPKNVKGYYLGLVQDYLTYADGVLPITLAWVRDEKGETYNIPTDHIVFAEDFVYTLHDKVDQVFGHEVAKEVVTIFKSL